MGRVNYHRGTTLLELLVAIALFMTASVLIFTTMQQTLRAGDQFNHASDAFEELQFALLAMDQDFSQLTDRAVRVVGDTESAFEFRDENKACRLSFTRYQNLDWDRGSLKRVAYNCSDQRLVRIAWAALDRTATTEGSQRVLLDEVEEISFSFLGSEKRWHSTWPPRNSGSASSNQVPAAVRVTLRQPGFGRLERIIITGTGL